MDKKGWHRQDIIAAVRKRGTTLRRLAIQHGFSDATLLKSLDRRWPNAHAVIARYLGLSRHDIWPHWYGSDGSPRHRTRVDLQRYTSAAREAA